MGGCVVGRDAEVKILDPTATIVGTAPPNECKFSISFSRSHRQDVSAEHSILKVFPPRGRAQLKITRFAHNKKHRGHFFSWLLSVFVFSWGGHLQLSGRRSCIMPVQWLENRDAQRTRRIEV
jgi:hypothetical protein